MTAKRRAPPSQADYAVSKTLHSTDRDTWQRIAAWQRAGLVTPRAGQAPALSRAAICAT